MTTADLFGVQLPLLAAPMAGRPSSPAVVTAVASVGGLGFLAAGYNHPLISPSRTHRDALVAPRFSRTVLTRVFTGRPARGLHVACTWPAQRLHRTARGSGPARLSPDSPPDQSAADRGRPDGDPDRLNLWAGTGYRLARTGPPAAVVTELAGSLQAGRHDLVVGGSARRQPRAPPGALPSVRPADGQAGRARGRARLAQPPEDPAPGVPSGVRLVRSAGASRGPAVPAVARRSAMAASPPPAYPPPPRSQWGPGRIIALVIGVLLLFPGLGLLIGGGALLWADGSHRTSDGYVMSGTQTFTSSGFALTSDPLNISTGADWLPVSSGLGNVRIEVTGTGSGNDVFVGIARTADARSYLDGVGRTVVDDVGSGSGQRLVDGGAPSGPPGDQNFWVAQASGSGTQQLTWKPAQGNWVLVVMNADGSANLSVRAGIGATVPSLGGLAWGVLITGAVITVIGVLLIVLAARGGSRRSGPPAAYQPVPATGGPAPAWGPPAPREPADGTPARPAHTGPPDEV